MMAHQSNENRLPETMQDALHEIAESDPVAAREFYETDIAQNWMDYDQESRNEYRRQVREARDNFRAA